MDQTTTAPAASGHKTYVFVDEYNRHKRLKVMRACDGCRKRKIRCDGALQNGPWPCGACLRLKLKCIPPMLDQEDDQQSLESTPTSNQFTFQNLTPPTPTISHKSNGISSQPTNLHEWNSKLAPIAPVSTSGPTSAPVYRDVDAAVYSSPLFSQQPGAQLEPGYTDDEYFASATAPAQFQSTRPGQLRLLRTDTQTSNDSSGDPEEVDAAVKELEEQMGELNITLTSIAPYIANENKNLAEMPPVEEVENILPPSVGADSTVRIPPEMMPSEEEAMNYFGYFFNYIHPYVPVLIRDAFYSQWHNDRDSISPLLLEAIFACVARYHEDALEMRRWLALASRHEESFKDVPRLSTIQALVLLIKAREAVPRRGYYYRSWMAVRYMTTMAADMGLNTHYARHRAGDTCQLDPSDCMLYTRIWQTFLLLEILVGAPQGRTDFAVGLDSVDFSLPTASPEINEFEFQASRRAAFFAQAVRNVKEANSMWQGLQVQEGDWALDPTFVSHNESIAKWLDTLPPDMQMHYADDDSPPWLGHNHHIAYLHMYHNLLVIIHHRPQIQMLLDKRDVGFKKNLDVCNEAAMRICRLQDALYRDYGLHGLTFMLRGIGFTVYIIITCTMLHLISITSPDPSTNSRARKYFTRHMQLLESCISSAAPELQVQINNLREAFSEDTSKPFELKSALGSRSPSTEAIPTPLSIDQDPQNVQVPGVGPWSQLQSRAGSQPLSSTSEYSQPFTQMPSQQAAPFTTNTFAMLTQPAYPSNLQLPTSTPPPSYALEPVISNEQSTPVWDPSGILIQWNTAFGAPQAPLATPQPPQPMPTDPRIQPTSAPVMSPHHPSSVQRPLYPSQNIPRSTPTSVVPSMPTVTPVMWEDAFTNAYVSGQGTKRYREEAMNMPAYGAYQKRRG